MHDGSETTYDSMLLVAYAGEKESLPFKVSIAIKPVNDEIPIVVNNTGATVWRGGICNITNTQLGMIAIASPLLLTDVENGIVIFFYCI